MHSLQNTWPSLHPEVVAWLMTFLQLCLWWWVFVGVVFFLCLFWGGGGGGGGGGEGTGGMEEFKYNHSLLADNLELLKFGKRFAEYWWIECIREHVVFGSWVLVCLCWQCVYADSEPWQCVYIIMPNWCWNRWKNWSAASIFWVWNSHFRNAWSASCFAEYRREHNSK